MPLHRKATYICLALAVLFMILHILGIGGRWDFDIFHVMSLIWVLAAVALWFCNPPNPNHRRKGH